jgi:hypothetical protein
LLFGEKFKKGRVKEKRVRTLESKLENENNYLV